MGKFEIHLSGINLKEIEAQSKGINLKHLEKKSRGKIAKDTPIFCYLKESKQTHIAKLQDKTTSIKIQIAKNLQKDSNNNLGSRYFETQLNLIGFSLIKIC
ncbi:hypothetical protein [Campylobacter troglodytis]|uniref:hypothetical protein n=1 Tax=Campylobacter troglodytis TaxID=654363 RepID=UPI001157630C|nr:hypothetical protein [Campylobacter troglodytis]TQR60459.1 hypothetical protein DMC01_05635 [Campylobacter troglodytis]